MGPRDDLGLKKFLRYDRIDVLKMDCAGCESALAQDILLEDPNFLHSVDQLAIAIDVSQQWLKTKALITWGCCTLSLKTLACVWSRPDAYLAAATRTTRRQGATRRCGRLGSLFNKE